MKIGLSRILLDDYELVRRTSLGQEYAWRALFRVEVVDVEKNEVIPEHFYFVVMSHDHTLKSQAALLQDGQLDVAEVVYRIKDRLSKIDPKNVSQFFKQMSEQFLYSD